MTAKTFFNSMASFGATLLLAGSAQAQSFFGLPLFGPVNNPPRYVSPCGPQGCPTNVYTGYGQRNCSGGVCNAPMNYAPTVCGPRGCWTPSNGPRTTDCICGNGVCVGNCPNPICQSGRGCASGNLPMNSGNPRCYGGGYSGYTVPNIPPREVYPNSYDVPRGYGSYRPIYRYEDVPSQVAPPVYRAPRYENGYYPGASRERDIETTQLDRSRSRFDSDRSPFYP